MDELAYHMSTPSNADLTFDCGSSCIQLTNDTDDLEMPSLGAPIYDLLSLSHDVVGTELLTSRALGGLSPVNEASRQTFVAVVTNSDFHRRRSPR
jgi:hypothetical protein